MSRATLRGLAVRKEIEVLSYGGGTQSTAMAVLIAQGRLPKPECVIIADTGYETQTTWDYWDGYAKPLFDGMGVRAVRISRIRDTRLSNERAKPIIELTGENGGRRRKAITVPVFITDADGNRAMLRNFCTHNWKRDVVRSWIYANYRDARRVVSWIGFSKDEMKRAARMKVNVNMPKWKNRFPLIELGLRRHDSIKLVREYGWPEPARSACWMCPFKSNDEWRHLRKTQPAEWEKAIKFERWVSDNCDQDDYQDHKITLHPSGMPLADAPISKNDNQQRLFCDSGSCFT